MNGNQQMRILFSDFALPYLLKDAQYPVGGWAVELDAWLEGLCACGAKPGVMSWKGANEYVGKHLNYDLLNTYDPNKGIPILKYCYYYIPTMLNAAKNFKPDIIIQSCSGLQTGIMAFIAEKLKVPFVFRAASDMDSDQRYAINLPLYAQLAYKYGLKKASMILAQNEYQYTNFKRNYPNALVFKIYNPFKISCEKKNLKISMQEKYIAWLGVFKEAKNLPLLNEIAHKLPDVTFHVAGMPSKTIDSRTQNAINEMETLPNVHFVGYINRQNIMDFLANAVALLSTSHYEGFSNTFLESLFAGTPLIIPARIDPDNIIFNHKLGLVAQKDEELPSLVSEIWNLSDKNYYELAKYCKSYIKKHHDHNQKAIELLSLLNKCSNNHSI